MRKQTVHEQVKKAELHNRLARHEIETRRTRAHKPIARKLHGLKFTETSWFEVYLHY